MTLVGALDRLPRRFAASTAAGGPHLPQPAGLKPLLQRIQNGEIDPSFLITHRVNIDDAAAAYKTFRNHDDDCIKVVLNPN